MARTLQPEDIIGHYKVIGPLGAGGMGEVYLAHDLHLERDVALKVLPAALVRSEDRVRRFIMEAKSASSLSHPHIVTIHEIGREKVRSTSGDDPAGEEIHYIAMELIRGDTVGDLIHGQRTDLKALLGYLAQAAEGLSKAHAAGIVHRDLKPGNIMVTADGYAKVLDFGLAKLTEKTTVDSDLTSAPTRTETTSAGAVVGTAGYMSPEQVKGKKVDHRSDVFSFGCILYEAATRTKPFAAESGFDMMHKIVHEEPAPVDALNPDAPAELRRLIRRCLAKSPDQRLQSIKDLAIEIREIVEEYETLSASATSASGVVPPVLAARKRPLVAAGVAVVLLMGLAGVVFGLWAFMAAGTPDHRGAPFQSFRVRSLLDHTQLGTATLSGDGRFLAYILGPEGHWSLRVRQIATGSDAEILPPQTVPIRGVCFSPDGDYLYYLGRDPETPIYSALFEVPSLGGTPRKRIFDIDSAITFSPDGTRAAFVRIVPDEGQTHLVVMDMATGTQEVLARVEDPDEIHPFARPAWSPDGTSIVCQWHTIQEGTKHALVAFDSRDGSRQVLTEPASPNISSFAWLPDGSGLMATTWAESVSASQVFFVPSPRGPLRQITSDVDGYGDVSVSSNGLVLAAVRRSSESRLWLAPADGSGALRPMTSRSSQDGISDIVPIPDGRIAFTARQEPGRQIWVMKMDGSERTALTAQEGNRWGLLYSSLGPSLLFNHYDRGEAAIHVWRLDLDDGGLSQLTRGSGENLLAVSRDGETVLFSRVELSRDIWRVSARGGEAERFLEGFLPGTPYSPDGRHLVQSLSEMVDGRNRAVTTIIPAEGGDPLARFMLPGDAADLKWHPDGRGLTYIHAVGGVENIWLQRLAGGDPVQVTSFTEGRIRGHEYAPVGERMFLIRAFPTGDNVWVLDQDGSEPVQVTEFNEGRVYAAAWTQDARGLVIKQGDDRQEVVLFEQAGS